MNTSQARKIIGTLMAAYPREAMNQETVGIWTRLIETFDYAEAYKAALRIVATRYTFPTIADLRGEIIEARLELPQPNRAYETWLDAAMGKGEPIHPFVREVAMQGGFDPWLIRSSEAPSITRSQFLKAYEERRRARIREENVAELRGGPAYAAVEEAEAAGAMAALGPAEGRDVGEAGPADDRDGGTATGES